MRARRTAISEAFSGPASGSGGSRSAALAYFISSPGAARMTGCSVRGRQRWRDGRRSAAADGCRNFGLSL